ncbi:hypothetical protein ABSA28_00477 [Candidatus Hepatincolaceae symbiont of Richtersius coronifer]
MKPISNLIIKILQLVMDSIKVNKPNKKTSQSFILLLAAAYGINYLTKEQLNYLRQFFQQINISWIDIYLFFINICVMALMSIGVWFVFIKVKKLNK